MLYWQNVFFKQLLIINAKISDNVFTGEKPYIYTTAMTTPDFEVMFLD